MNRRVKWFPEIFHAQYILHSLLVFRVSSALNFSKSDLIHTEKDLIYWVTCFDLQLGSVNQLSFGKKLCSVSKVKKSAQSFDEILLEKSGQNKYFTFSFKLHMQENSFHSEQKKYCFSCFNISKILCSFILVVMTVHHFKTKSVSWIFSEIPRIFVNQKQN